MIFWIQTLHYTLLFTFISSEKSAIELANISTKNTQILRKYAFELHLYCNGCCTQNNSAYSYTEMQTNRKKWRLLGNSAQQIVNHSLFSAKYVWETKCPCEKTVEKYNGKKV